MGNKELAAFLQAFGVGIVLGYHSRIGVYATTLLSLGLVLAGYVVDKRATDE